MSIRSCPSLQTVQITISAQSRFCMTINKAQGRTLKCAGIYLPSPVFFHGSCMWHFPDPLHLTTSLLQLLKGTDKVRKKDRLVT